MDKGRCPRPKNAGGQSEDTAQGCPRRDVEFPVGMLRDAELNPDGSTTYTIPRHFRILIDVEPLNPRYPPLDLHNTTKL